MRLRLVRAVALMTALSPALAMAQDAEEEARQLLVEAIRAYQAASEAEDLDARITALEEAQTALDRIESEYETTDTGIDILTGAMFGEFDPNDVETSLAQAQEERQTAAEIGACTTAPTFGCVRAMLEQHLAEDPDALARVHQATTRLATAYRIAFDEAVDPLDVPVGDNGEFVEILAALMAFGGGSYDRSGAFLHARKQSQGIEPASMQSALFYPVVENFGFFFSEDTDTALRRSVHDLAEAEFTRSGDPVAGLAASVLTRDPDAESIQARLEDVPPQVTPAPPDWLYLSVALRDPGAEMYENVLTSGLNNVPLDLVKPETVIAIAEATIERGDEGEKGRTLWYAAAEGVASDVIATAEKVGGPFENRGYFGAALGARQLGWEGDRDTFERLIDLIVFPGEQDAGVAMVERNFAFGRALAGDPGPLAARDDVDPSIIELADILEGVPAAQLEMIFGYAIDQRLGNPVANQLDRARAFTWFRMSADEATRLAELHPTIFLAGYEWAADEGETDIGALMDVLRRMDKGLAVNFLTRLSETDAIASAVDDFERMPVEFYLLLLAHPEIVESGAARDM